MSPVKIIGRKIQRSKPAKIVRTFSLQDFYEKRNKILVVRRVGGLGDILMHRMMFKDFKRLMPDAEIHFACPSLYHEALVDHPYIDKILDVTEANKDDYILVYNTTSACGRYESRLAPFSGDHRSDIWAAHCGVVLTDHDMHINVSDEEKKEGKNIIEKYRNKKGPAVALCPVSAMYGKNLLPSQMDWIIKASRNYNFYLFGLHRDVVPHLMQRNIPMIHNLNIRQWMAVLNQADYVISVDTSSFHCAGGMKKPLTGIFTFADGKVYGKYYDFFLVQKHRDDGNWDCGPCYNWGVCPKTKSQPKPCLTEITEDMIVSAIDKMLNKWPQITSLNK